MDLPEQLAFDRLSSAEKYHRAVPGYMKRLSELYAAICERFGDDGLDLIRDVSRKYGTQIGMNVKKGGELEGVAAVGRYLLKVFDMVSDDWEVTEFSESRLAIAVHRCPYSFSVDKLCRAHTCMEQALVAALDPNLEYRISRSIPRGDPFCEHVLCERSAVD